MASKATYAKVNKVSVSNRSQTGPEVCAIHLSLFIVYIYLDSDHNYDIHRIDYPMINM